jgi:hypothetical protein
VKNLGKAVSHGCVRLSPENAAALYNSVEAKGMANTQVVVQEGDAGVAQGAKPRKRTPPTYPADDYAEQPAASYGCVGSPGGRPTTRPAEYNQRPY